jgi:uncharacterized lipoprotein YmbA
MSRLNPTLQSSPDLTVERLIVVNQLRPIAVGGRRLTALLSVLAVVAITGCSKPKVERLQVFPVSGKFTASGKATPGALIVLHPQDAAVPDTVRPSGMVQPDGSFKLTTYDQFDGAPPGNYNVTVQWFKAVKQGGDVLPGPNLLPQAYGDPKTSKLSVEVASAPTDLKPIDIKSR